MSEALSQTLAQPILKTADVVMQPEKAKRGMEFTTSDVNGDQRGPAPVQELERTKCLCGSNSIQFVNRGRTDQPAQIHLAYRTYRERVSVRSRLSELTMRLRFRSLWKQHMQLVHLDVCHTFEEHTGTLVVVALRRSIASG